MASSSRLSAPAPTAVAIPPPANRNARRVRLPRAMKAHTLQRYAEKTTAIRASTGLNRATTGACATSGHSAAAAVRIATNPLPASATLRRPAAPSTMLRRSRRAAYLDTSDVAPTAPSNSAANSAAAGSKAEFPMLRPRLLAEQGPERQSRNESWLTSSLTHAPASVGRQGEQMGNVR